jgi:hypothetical protein
MCPYFPYFLRTDSVARRQTGNTSSTPRGHPPMNRRYAYHDYQILVTALPAGDRPGWRPEICVISPDDEWQFVPTLDTWVATDAHRCIEIGRLCAESVVEDMRLSAGAPRIGTLH